MALALELRAFGEVGEVLADGALRAAQIDGVTGANLEAVVELHEQLLAALDGHHRAAGALADAGRGRSLTLEAACGHLGQAHARLQRDELLAKELAAQELPGDLADGQGEVGARQADALDLLRPLDAGDDRHLGGKVPDDGRRKQVGAVARERQDHGSGLPDSGPIECLRVERVGHDVDPVQALAFR